jgi:hypothetical protein
MAIREVLISQRQWGESRSRGFLARLGLHETKTVGSMTTRQRAAAAAMLTRGQVMSTQPDHMSSREPAAETVRPVG